MMARTNDAEMLRSCFTRLYDELVITKIGIGFWCPGSSDYLAEKIFVYMCNRLGVNGRSRCKPGRST